MISEKHKSDFSWYSLVFLLICIVIAIIVLLLLRWPGSLTQNYSTLVVGALGALGTILLAMATLKTVRQNRKNLRELKKDRQKPLAIDEINNVVDPVIRWTDKEIAAYEEQDTEGTFIEWSYIEDPLGYPGSRRPGSLIPLSNPDRTALRRLHRDQPELISKIEERDQLLLSLREQAHEIIDVIEPKVNSCLEKEGIESDGKNNSTQRILCDSILQQIDYFGENSELYDFWEEYGEELNQMIWDEAEEEFSDLLSGEEEFIQLEKEIREDMQTRKNKLKESYGISSDDLDEEHNGLMW